MLVVDGKNLKTDDEGYLLDLSDWQPSVAQAMAASDNCELSEDHWEIIEFLRDYHENFGVVPPARAMSKAIARRLGADKSTSRYLTALFPLGPARQASKYAGLPKPSGCI